jgi:hypothetical protein
MAILSLEVDVVGVDLTEEVAGVEGMGVDSFVVGVEEGAGDLEEVAIEKYTIRSS